MLAASPTTLPLFLALSACKGPAVLSGPPPVARQTQTLLHAVTAELNLIWIYNKTMAEYSALAPTLAPLLAEHQAHLARLRARVIEPPGKKVPDTVTARPAIAATAVGRARPAAGRRAGRGRARCSAGLARRCPVAGAALRVDRNVGGDPRDRADQPDLAGPDGRVKPASADAADIAALQAALAAEHAAVYGYGIVGAMVTGGAETLARADWLAHQEARDTLEAMLVKLGATPVAASPAYQLPFAVTGEASAVRLAAALEDGVTQAYLGRRGRHRPDAAVLRRAGDAAARESGARLARHHGCLSRNADDHY